MIIQKKNRDLFSAWTRVRLTAKDNKAGESKVYYSINGIKDVLNTEPFLLDVKATTVNIRYYAIDNIQNSSKGKAYAGSGKLNLNVIRDENPPKISLSYTSPNITVNKMLYLRETSRIIINATDGLSGVKNISYELDEKKNEYEKAFSVKDRR